MELSSLVASVTLLFVSCDLPESLRSYIKEFGFFFFLRIAVEVSSSTFFSAPEASLQDELVCNRGDMEMLHT